MSRPVVTFNGLDLTASDSVYEVDWARAQVEDRSRQLARDRDAYARRLLEDRLPRPLHFLLDRPSALRRLFRVVPRWRPTMTVVDLRGRSPVQHEARLMLADLDGRVPLEMPYPSMTADTARVVADSWVAEIRAAGKQIPDGGLVFTYTDPSGLPAEVYAP